MSLRRAGLLLFVGLCLAGTLLAQPTVASHLATETGDEGAWSGDNGANLTVWTAPGNQYDRLTEDDAIAAAKRSGTLTRDGTVVPADTVVLRLKLPGLDDRVSAASGPNVTMRFFDATSGPRSVLELIQANPITSRLPQGRILNQTASTSVVAAPAEDAYYLVVSLPATRSDRGRTGERNWSAGSGTLEHGADFFLNATIDGQSRVFVGGDRVHDSPVVEVAEPDVELWATEQLDRVTVAPAANQTLRARTSYAPGTNVTLRVENRSDGGSALVSETVVRPRSEHADPPSRFEPHHRVAADVNASGFANGTTFDLVVKVRETTARFPGVVDQSYAATEVRGTDTETATETATDGATTSGSQTTSESGANDPTVTRDDSTPTGPGVRPLGTVLAVVGAVVLLGRRSV